MTPAANGLRFRHGRRRGRGLRLRLGQRLRLRHRVTDELYLGANDGVPGRTAKLVIGGVDVYLTVAWRGERPVHIGMVISGGKNKNPLIEVAIGHALRLLQCGKLDVAGLCREWRGTHFEPAGPCPQLEAIVSSPLDAAARWIEAAVQTGPRGLCGIRSM